MERLRGKLTYSNVMATVAVFIALGGGAYALTRGEVKSKHIAKDAVKAKHIDFGTRSTPMFANFAELGQGNGGTNYAPVGASALTGGTVHEMLAPQAFIATGLRIRLDSPLATGSREFVFRYFDTAHHETALRCDVGAGEATCQSEARVRVPSGSSVWFTAEHTGTTQGGYAEVGWRAVLP